MSIQPVSFNEWLTVMQQKVKCFSAYSILVSKSMHFKQCSNQKNYKLKISVVIISMMPVFLFLQERQHVG